MKRRIFLRAAAGVVPATVMRAASAQRAARVMRVGWVNASSEEINEPIFATFRDVLATHGYVAGRNVAFDSVHADGELRRLPALIRELVARQPDIIAAQTFAAILPLAAATATIPIVMVAGGDPVAAGLTASLARPSRNITGFSSLREAVIPKAIDLLRQIAPRTRHIAVVHGAEDPGGAILRATAEGVVSRMAIAVTAVAVRDSADAIPALRAALAMPETARPDALIVNSDAVIWPATPDIAAFAAAHRLPAAYTQRQMAVDGGLIAVAFDPFETARGAADYAARILNGTPVAQLPFQQASRILLTVNLDAARRAGIELPAGLVALADEVIE